MKAKIGTGALTLALLLAGCGEGGDANNAAPVNTAAPLPQIAAPNNGDWTEMVEQTAEGGFRMGNPDAPVKLVEYASLTCPHCATFSETATEPLREYVRSGQVSWEFRNFILNAPDAAASVAARCLTPTAFFRVVEQLYADQETWIGALDEAEGQQIQSLPTNQQPAALIRAMDLDQFFQQRGLPEARLNQCLSNQQELERLVEIRDAGAGAGVTGTPSFFINGELIENVFDWQSLEPILRRSIGG